MYTPLLSDVKWLQLNVRVLRLPTQFAGKLMTLPLNLSTKDSTPKTPEKSASNIKSSPLFLYRVSLFLYKAMLCNIVIEQSYSWSNTNFSHPFN